MGTIRALFPSGFKAQLAHCRGSNAEGGNHRTFLKEWFGRNWVYVLGPVIGSIKLPEFYAEAEASKSLRAAWVVAVNERERRRNWRQPATRAVTKRLMPRGDHVQAAEPDRAAAEASEPVSISRTRLGDALAGEIGCVGVFSDVCVVAPCCGFWYYARVKQVIRVAWEYRAQTKYDYSTICRCQVG